MWKQNSRLESKRSVFKPCTGKTVGQVKTPEHVKEHRWGYTLELKLFFGRDSLWLQSRASINRGHPTKFLLDFDNFWHLYDSFLMVSLCNSPIKMQGLWEAELSNVGKPTWRLTTPPSPILAFWLASLKGRHQTAVKKMPQNCQKLIKNFVRGPRLDARWLQDPCEFAYQKVMLGKFVFCVKRWEFLEACGAKLKRFKPLSQVPTFLFLLWSLKTISQQCCVWMNQSRSRRPRSFLVAPRIEGVWAPLTKALAGSGKTSYPTMIPTMLDTLQWKFILNNEIQWSCYQHSVRDTR